MDDEIERQIAVFLHGPLQAFNEMLEKIDINFYQMD